MRFSDILKRFVSVEVKTRRSIKFRLFSVPILKIRTKMLSMAFARVFDLFFYRFRKGVLAIKCPSPPDEGRLKWGDYWIAEDLKKEFEKTGQTARIDYVDRFSYPSDKKNARTLTIRGLSPYTPPEGSEGKHVLYLLSHPDQVSAEELSGFDAVACASLTYAEKLKNEGVNCEFVPQFTDPAKFFPSPSADLRTALLFVGNSRGVFRNGVKFALEKNLPITVYGADWERFGVKTAGTGIANADLNKYYSSADIVLCDHWTDMSQNGFIANRLFDATACGAFVISDYCEAIERLFGDAVPMYRNAGELKELVDYYLPRPSERREKAEKAKEITLKGFTVKAVVKRLNALFERA